MTDEQRKDMHTLKMKVYAIHEEIRNKYLIINQNWSTPVLPELNEEEKRQLWQVLQSFMPARTILNELGMSASDKMWRGMADAMDRHNANWEEAWNGPDNAEIEDDEEGGES